MRTRTSIGAAGYSSETRLSAPSIGRAEERPAPEPLDDEEQR